MTKDTEPVEMPADLQRMIDLLDDVLAAVAGIRNFADFTKAQIEARCVSIETDCRRFQDKLQKHTRQ